MYVLGKINVTAVVPDSLSKLKTIANNLWWSWNHDAIGLFKDLDQVLWEKLKGNPVRLLQEISQKTLEEKSQDKNFKKQYDALVEKFENYMDDKKTWFLKHHPAKKNHSIAYFSAEYGISEVLPVYSGGLGVLSGDHCKSASDLGLPFTAIGLFYKQGYFKQRLNREGWQETQFYDLNISQLPISPAVDSSGKQIIISVELPGREVYAKVWKIQVGRINLYLMDTNVEGNSPHDKDLTSRLYGGDNETRIQQEIFLGIGGIRVLDALGITPTCYHMNEGHSSFLGLELIRKLVNSKNLTFEEAKEVVSSSTVFTTHTPVPAGNDVFPIAMIDKYFSNYWNSLGVNRHEFLDLGLKVNDPQNFNMTVLALSLAGRKNGVSELHGAVSRNIFQSVWPGLPENDIPIAHITNGIHTNTWLSPSIKHVYDKYLGEDWEKEFHEKATWDKVDNIPDDELWKTHNVLKTKMIHFVREKLKEQRIANGDSSEKVREVDSLLDSNAFTIGFARRFATYKRANLIFRNLSRIQKIINNPNMPVQIIFAGKAHPADRPAHEIIKNLNDIASQEGFVGKVVVVENYNMSVARHLVQGVDVWLNNPRRPLEASGTSGQKVCINGIINFSVLDGWWCEGYNGKNGWAIGDDTFYENEFFQDNADSESIYETLENEILPLFYKRDDGGVPHEWVQVMKESIKSNTYKFSTNRMVLDYFHKMYLPAFERMDKIHETKYTFAKSLAKWKSNMEKSWSQVSITANKSSNNLKDLSSLSGEAINISSNVFLGNISPDSVSVQLYYGPLNSSGQIESAKTKEMELSENLSNSNYSFSTAVTILEGGEYGYTLRVVPKNPDLIDPYDMGLIRWVL